MDISTVVLQLVFIFASVDGNPVYKFQRFCGNNLSNELKKYGCVYHDNTNTFSISNEGITHECCERPCTSHHLITSYCANSNISAYTTQTPPITNAVNKLNATFYETDGYPKSNQIVPDAGLKRNDIPRGSSHAPGSAQKKDLSSNKLSKVVVMETGTNPPIRVKPFH